MPKVIYSQKPSQKLTLPDGYQRMDWYKEGQNKNGVVLNNPDYLVKRLDESYGRLLYCYTQHEIFFQDNVLKHTRSSPNWDGGLVTYATCKHLMRTYDREQPHPVTGSPCWLNTWIVGLCPASINNCVLFCGVVWKQFDSNYDLSRYIKKNYPQAFKAKEADNNPRGDLYTPLYDVITKKSAKHNHKFFLEPSNPHTRSVEFYKKSPGSKSERPDGKVPKWWRDIEYKAGTGRRPISFILNPCFLFSRPMLWTSYYPGRASLKLDPKEFANSLEMQF